MRRNWRTLSQLARFAIGFAAAGILLFFAAVALFFFAPSIGGPSAEAVHHSVARHSGGSSSGGDLDSCSARGAGLLVCDVPFNSGSGAARYRVQLDGRCYHARKLSSPQVAPYLKLAFEACVALRDQARPADRFWEAVDGSTAID